MRSGRGDLDQKHLFGRLTMPDVAFIVSDPAKAKSLLAIKRISDVG